MKLGSFCIFIFFSISFVSISQNNIEFSIFESIINSQFGERYDTIFRKNGKVKKIEYKKPPALIIKKKTGAFLFDKNRESLESIKRYYLRNIDSTMYSNFVENISEPIEISNLNLGERKLNYKTQEDLDKLFNNGGWENLNKIYGNDVCIINFSRVGFNKDKSRAFVYYTVAKGYLSGGGYYVVLEFKNSKWIILEKRMIWVS